MSISDSERLRVLILAPFPRDLDHGGSQRATGMAERLEERGAEVEWRVVHTRDRSRASRLMGDLVLRPALIDIYPLLAPPPGHFDVAIASHSYLAPQLESLPSVKVRMVDFHNLEWQHLADSARFARGIRHLHPRLQVALMRRFERRVIAANDLSTFVRKEELAWARASAPQAELALVPSVLPRRTEQQALALCEKPRDHSEARLCYVGSLRFRPNFKALLRFLHDMWPFVRDAAPDLRLTIAGDCSEEVRRRLDDFPGVEALGFVDDIGPLLERSAAVIMPIEGRAGTSLRALYSALAGVWVIGSPDAFRGLPWKMGTVVESPVQWARTVSEVIHAPGDQASKIGEARAAALELQRDPKPWDDLMGRLTELCRREVGSGPSPSAGESRGP